MQNYPRKCLVMYGATSPILLQSRVRLISSRTLRDFPSIFIPNSYEIRKWVCVLHFSPCYNSPKCPVRTWRPDFLLKLSNGMPDFQAWKNLWRRFHERAPQRGQLHPQTDTHTFHADIVLALRPNPDRLKLRRLRDYRNPH